MAERELAKQPLTRDEIMRLSKGNPVSLIDRRKPSFKKLAVGDRPLSADEAIGLMGKDPSIIRRPIFEIDGEVLFGYSPAELEKRLKA
jgi:arsenate reductase-like glutaredoxin family protein